MEAQHNMKTLRMKANAADLLQLLSDEVRLAISQLEPTTFDWVYPLGTDIDVGIIGGGQSGIAIAFGLRRAGIKRVKVFDSAEPGTVGVWNTVARMKTLRAGKGFTGLEQGIPQLTFEHWFTRLYGAEQFKVMPEIPRSIWFDYLNWYRETTDIEVMWLHQLISIDPISEDKNPPLKLSFLIKEGSQVSITTQTVVLATGIDGFGEPHIPSALSEKLPKNCLSHTHDPIDFLKLRGKRIGVVGAAASAFDAASAALECGAAEVHQFIRHASLVQANDLASAKPSADKLFYTLFSDELRLRIVSERRRRSSAPETAIARARQYANHRLHFNVNEQHITMKDDQILVQTDSGDIPLDYIIAGTGYRQNIRVKQELGTAAPHVMLWGDRVNSVETESGWLEHPYLGAGFELQEKEPGNAPWLQRIHIYTFAAIVSHGIHVGDIGSAFIGLPRLVSGITHTLFRNAIVDYEQISIQGPAIVVDRFTASPDTGIRKAKNEKL